MRIRLKRFFHRCIGIVAMRLVEIDVIGLETFERSLGLAHDPRAGEAFALAGNFRSNLGGDDHLLALAATLEPVADDGLRFAALVAGHPRGISVRGINEVKAGGNESIENLE